MKRYVRQIAIGLVLILLSGILAGCGEPAPDTTGVIETTPDSTETNSQSVVDTAPDDGIDWSLPLGNRKWLITGFLYAIIEIKEIEEPAPNDNLFFATCNVILTNAIDIEYFRGKNIDVNIAYVDFPVSWYEKLETGQTYLVEVKRESCETYRRKDSSTAHVWLQSSRFNDGDGVVITPVEDGKLVFDETDAIFGESVSRGFAMIRIVNRELEEGDPKTLSVQLLRANIEKPVQSGMTIEELLAYIEGTDRAYSWLRQHWDEEWERLNEEENLRNPK